MQKDEPLGKKPHTSTALKRALKALSLAMSSLRQVEAPALEPS